MIPGTLNPEIHVTKIEIQNDIKSTEIKNSDNKCLTSVINRETLKQKNAEEHENNAEIINVLNVDTAVSNVQKHGINAAVTNIYRMEKGDTKFRKADFSDPESKNPAIFPKRYWVQINIQSNMPENSSPLGYDSSRNAFVALTFAITFFMLIITAAIVGFIYFTENLRDYFIHDGQFLFYIGLGGTVMLSYTMMCSTCARMLPCNIIVLVLTVIFTTLIVAYITVRYRTDLIIIAMIVTAVTVFLCFCLALTSFDFTSFLLYVIGICAAFFALVLVVGIVSLTTGVTYKPLHLAILAVGTILNVVMLIIELQMILGGKTVELSEDDWALAAYLLYTSIIDLFLKILQLLASLEDD